MLRDLWTDSGRWAPTVVASGWPGWERPRRGWYDDARAAQPSAVPLATRRTGEGGPSTRIPVTVRGEPRAEPEPLGDEAGEPQPEQAEARNAGADPMDVAQEVPPPSDPLPSGAGPAAAHDAALRAKLRASLEELEAAKRRVERDAERARDALRAELVEKLLPVLDSLELSLAAATADGEPAFVEGLRLVQAQFEAVLGSYGLERVEADGQRFDPELHEALGVSPVERASDDGLVVRQWQPGYRFGGKVLRAAKVLVGRHA